MVEVVRQDQDEPGDVNLLLSPLTLAFAGGNTFLRRYCRRCYLQTHRRTRSVYHICITNEDDWRAKFGYMHACPDEYIGYRQWETTRWQLYHTLKAGNGIRSPHFQLHLQLASSRKPTCHSSGEVTQSYLYYVLYYNGNLNDDAILMMVIWQANGAPLNFYW